MENNFNKTISAEIATKKLRGILDRLEDEATPYEMRVVRAAPGVKLVTIQCDSENAEYFNKLLMCDED